MDIVDFWNKQVVKWNAEKKCGFCWNFGAPLTQSQMNIQQIEDQCCINVFLTDIYFNESISYSSKTGFVNGKSSDWDFTLWVLQHGKLGVNNYNEIKGHSVDNSNWLKTYKPIYECLGSDVILESCKLMGLPITVVRWQGSTVFNYEDNNYNGWKIQATFKL